MEGKNESRKYYLGGKYAKIISLRQIFLCLQKVSSVSSLTAVVKFISVHVHVNFLERSNTKKIHRWLSLLTTWTFNHLQFLNCFFDHHYLFHTFTDLHLTSHMCTNWYYLNSPLRIHVAVLEILVIWNWRIQKEKISSNEKIKRSLEILKKN